MKTGNQELDVEYYDNAYAYGYYWGAYQQLGTKLVEYMLQDKCENKKIIDIGCGVGWYTDVLYFNVSKDIVGIDFSGQAILFHGLRLYPALDLRLENIFDFDYKNYQVAVLMEVLEHIDKDIELLQKLPKGMNIYATVPFEKERDTLAHVREYTLQETKDRYSEVIDINKLEKFGQFIIITGIKK